MVGQFIFPHVCFQHDPVLPVQPQPHTCNVPVITSLNPWDLRFGARGTIHTLLHCRVIATLPFPLRRRFWFGTRCLPAHARDYPRRQTYTFLPATPTCPVPFPAWGSCTAGTACCSTCLLPAVVRVLRRALPYTPPPALRYRFINSVAFQLGTNLTRCFYLLPHALPAFISCVSRFAGLVPAAPQLFWRRSCPFAATAPPRLRLRGSLNFRFVVRLPDATCCT